jgi:hypothetical protein
VHIYTRPFERDAWTNQQTGLFHNKLSWWSTCTIYYSSDKFPLVKIKQLPAATPNKSPCMSQPW